MTPTTDRQQQRQTDKPRPQMSVTDERPILDAPTLLAFEAANTHDGPNKNLRIRRELGITEVRYAVLLMRAARSADGIAADPVTARIVRERAEMRARARGRRQAA